MSLLFSGGTGSFPAFTIPSSTDFNITLTVTLSSSANNNVITSTGTDYIAVQRASNRVRGSFAGQLFTVNTAGLVTDDVLVITASRTGTQLTLSVSGFGSSTLTVPGAIAFNGIAGAYEFVDLDMSAGADVRTYDFAQSTGATTVIDTTGSQNITLAGSYAFSETGNGVASAVTYDRGGDFGSMQLLAGATATLAQQFVATGRFLVRGKIKINSATATQESLASASDLSGISYQGGSNRFRAYIGSTNYTITDTNLRDGQIVDFEFERDASNVVSLRLGGIGLATTPINTSTFTISSLVGTNPFYDVYLNNYSDQELRYNFNLADGATTIPDLIGSNNATISGTTAFLRTGLVNTSFDTYAKNIGNYWNTRNTPDGLVTVTRAQIDDSTSLPFARVHHITEGANNYYVTGDTLWLDRHIAHVNTVMDKRDDFFAAGGGVLFPAPQTGYRVAPAPYIGTTNPAPVWSYDYTDTAVGANAQATGKRTDILQTGLIGASLMMIMFGYSKHRPTGSYVAPAGAVAGPLSGTYEQCIATLCSLINDTVRVFDPLWTQDRTNVSSGDGFFDVEGSYVYPSRQNVSLSGLQLDNLAANNHQSAFFQMRLLLASFSTYDQNAFVEYFKWLRFTESVMDNSNPGLVGTGGVFGYDDLTQSYSWPYVNHLTFNEDIDHTFITTNGWSVSQRLGLISSEYLQDRLRAVETVYQAARNPIYDKIHDYTDDFVSFAITAGIANKVAAGTNLQIYLRESINTTHASANTAFQTYAAVNSYYIANQLGEPYVSVTYNGLAPTFGSSESFAELIFNDHGVTLVSGDEVYFTTTSGSTISDSTVPAFASGAVEGWYGFIANGVRSQLYNFSVQDFVPATAISGNQNISVVENATFSNTYLVVNPVGATTISGLDAGNFTFVDNGSSVTVSGTAINFEQPIDAGADNIYNFSLSNNGFDLPIVLTVTNDLAEFTINAISNVNIDEGVAYTSVTPSIVGTPELPVIYSLTGADASQFTVNSSTGVTSMIARTFSFPTDANSNNVYEVGLIATDNAGQTATQSWTLTVIAVSSQVTGTSVESLTSVSNAFIDANYVAINIQGSSVESQTTVSTTSVVTSNVSYAVIGNSVQSQSVAGIGTVVLGSVITYQVQGNSATSYSFTDFADISWNYEIIGNNIESISLAGRTYKFNPRIKLYLH